MLHYSHIILTRNVVKSSRSMVVEHPSSLTTPTSNISTRNEQQNKTSDNMVEATTSISPTALQYVLAGIILGTAGNELIVKKKKLFFLFNREMPNSHTVMYLFFIFFSSYIHDDIYSGTNTLH